MRKLSKRKDGVLNTIPFAFFFFLMEDINKAE